MSSLLTVWQIQERMWNLFFGFFYVSTDSHHWTVGWFLFWKKIWTAVVLRSALIAHTLISYAFLLYVCSRKILTPWSDEKWNYLGIFPQPSPSHLENKIYGLFDVLGPKKRPQKCYLFHNLLLGIGNSPWRNFPPKTSCLFIFFRIKRPRPEIRFNWISVIPFSDQIDQISPPSFCKTCSSSTSQ